MPILFRNAIDLSSGAATLVCPSPGRRARIRWLTGIKRSTLVLIEPIDFLPIGASFLLRSRTRVRRICRIGQFRRSNQAARAQAASPRGPQPRCRFAHSDRDASDAPPMTFSQLNEAIDSCHELVKPYIALLTGQGYHDMTPVEQTKWCRIFEPWERLRPFAQS